MEKTAACTAEREETIYLSDSLYEEQVTRTKILDKHYGMDFLKCNYGKIV